jgi:hypothetical protein
MEVNRAMCFRSALVVSAATALLAALILPNRPRTAPGITLFLIAEVLVWFVYDLLIKLSCQRRDRELDERKRRQTELEGKIHLRVRKMIDGVTWQPWQQ